MWLTPKGFLTFSAVVWLPYGLYCFINPEALAETAGVTATTATGTIELRAMYGGLQAAVGSLALAGSLRDAWQRAALMGLFFVCAGLGSARLLAAVSAGELSFYTSLGLLFEWGSTAAAAWLLTR
jgi:hypothetical protein